MKKMHLLKFFILIAAFALVLTGCNAQDSNPSETAGEPAIRMGKTRRSLPNNRTHKTIRTLTAKPVLRLMSKTFTALSLSPSIRLLLSRSTTAHLKLCPTGIFH